MPGSGATAGGGPPPPAPPSPPFGPCPNPPTPQPPPSGTWTLGTLTEYFVVATFADGTTATFPPGSFDGGVRDGDTVTVLVE